MVIAWGKCTLGREATPTSIRTESGTVVMSSSLKHRHGPPVITVVPVILCKEYTSVPRPAHRSVTHSLVLIVLISHPLHLHMNEKSSQLVNYHVVRVP